MALRGLTTWVGLFALVANASHGLGLELGQPLTADSGATVCGAQSVLSTLAAVPPDASSNVCAYQIALDAVCEEETDGATVDSIPLLSTMLVQDLPDWPEAPMPSAASLLLSPGLKRPADSIPAFSPPPGSLPTEQRSHALRVPNAPPRIA